MPDKRCYDLPTGGRRSLSTFLKFLVICLAVTAGCRKNAVPTGVAQDLDATEVRMRACLPPRNYRPNDGNIRMAINRLSREPGETRVRIVAYAVNEAGTFDFPTYSLSRGRWLIAETGRAFLLDQNCRQYRLKGRSTPSGRKIPIDGKVNLKPGEAFEADLSFPSLLGKPYILLMVYGDLILPLPPLASTPSNLGRKTPVPET